MTRIEIKGTGPFILRGRFWLVAGALIAGLYFARGPLGAVLALPLTPRPADAQFDCLWLQTDWGFARAAELFREGPQRPFVTCEPPWNRLTAAGVLPSYPDLMRAKLVAEGVPRSALQVVPGRSCTDWDCALQIGRWLAAHPQQRVRLLIDGFEGAALYWTVSRVIEPELRQRLTVEAVCPAWCTRENWWQSRLGVKQFCAAWLQCLHAWRYGHLPARFGYWDAAAYERWLGEEGR